MTGRDDEGGGTPATEHERPEEREPAGGGARQAGSAPAPEPEEVPELLGERSDYPLAWDGEER